RIAAYQILFLRVPAYAAVDDAVAAARAFGGGKLAGFANAVLRKLTGEPSLPADPMERLSVEHSLPRWILDELAASLASTDAAIGGPAATRSRTAGDGVDGPATAGFAPPRPDAANAVNAASQPSTASAPRVPVPTLAAIAAAFAEPAPVVARANLT